MKSLIVVSTCPRPNGVSYLMQTLSNIDKEGGMHIDKLILSNGEMNECPSAWDYLETHHALPISTRTNLWQAFSIAKTRNVDSLLFFEDDIVLCKNAVARMLEVDCPSHCTFVSFFDNNRGRSSKWGIQTSSLPKDFNGQLFHGTLAMSFPKKTIEFLADKDPFSLRTDQPHRQADTVMAEICATSPWPHVAHHIPSLVRHVGEISVAWPEKKRTKQDLIPESYQGDDFDPLENESYKFAWINRANHIFYELPGWFDFSDIYDQAIYEARQKSVSPRMVEVGIFAGRSLSYLVVQAMNQFNSFSIFGIDKFGAENQPSPEKVCELFEKMYVGDSVTIYQKPSVEASRSFRDGSLDFCFIDADHSYQGVLADLTAWWPKMKRGSIFAGHDYNQGSHPGVVSAVNAFFMRAGVPVKFMMPNSWMVRKT